MSFIRKVLHLLSDTCKVMWLRKTERNLLFFGYEDSSSGAAILSLHMVKALSAKHNIVFVTAQKGDLDSEYLRYAARVLYLPNRRIYKLLYKKGFHNAVLNALPSCFDAEHLKNTGYHIVTLIHELHRLIEQFDMHDDVYRAKRFSDVVIFPSLFCRRSFEEHYGPITAKVLIKPQGLFLTRGFVSNKSANKQFVSKEYGLHPSASIVLMVGIGDYRKGMDMFLELCAQNIESDIQFIHIGRIVDDVREEWLRQHQTYPKNFINVDFISNPEILFRFYDAADVLAMLSREEPFGSVVLEAFSAGTPVVGFENSGGYNDIVINGETGWLAPYLDLACLDNKLHELLMADTKRMSMGQRARELVSEMTFDDYIALLESCLIN